MTATASPIRNGRSQGFTYVSVVILVTIIGLVGALSLRLGTSIQRALAEQALLDIGIEYSNALASYAAATPQGQPNYPKSFAELLKDPRFPQLKRHLRRVYVDPMTGKAEWGIVKATENGGILSIYSLSKAVPIKIGNFPARFSAFEGRTSYADWKFSGEGVQMPGTKGGDGQPTGQQPGQPNKPGAGMPPSPMTGGTQPGTPIGGKPGTPQPDQSKPAEPQPAPAPEPEPPQEPPQEPQEAPPEPAPAQPDEPARDEAPAPSKRS